MMRRATVCGDHALQTSNSLHPCPYLDTCEECTVSMCAYVPGKNHQVSLKENGKNILGKQTSGSHTFWLLHKQDFGEW